MIQIQNNKESAKVEIMGTIGQDFWGEGWTLDRFKNEIRDLDVPVIEVEIKSLGGDALEAFAIYDAIRAMPQKVVTRMIGTTASAGTLIAMAGDEREISENSRFLIHNVRSFVDGTAEDMEKAAEVLNDFDDQLAKIYQKATGKHKSTMLRMMKEERFLSAQEAKDLGFVNKISKTKMSNQKENIMQEDVMKLLGVKNETDMLKATNDLVEKLEKLEKENAELVSKVNDYVVAEEQKKAETINEFIENAVKEGRIPENAKEKWFNLAVTDFEAVKETISAINLVKEGFENFVEPAEEDAGMTKVEKFYKNYKENKYANNPEAYKADFAAAFGQ